MQSSRRRRWPDVQFFFPPAVDGGAPRDEEQPADATTRRSDCKDEPAEDERFDILSALPEEVALRVLGGGELATRLAENSCSDGGGPTWSAWELRHVVSRVCRNWRRLALDAGLLASTLHQYHRGRTGPIVSPGGEVIHVQIGNCGNMVGKEYWRALVHEHSLDPSSFAISGSSPFTEQITGLPVSFDESATGRFTARSILVDTDPASLDLIRASPLAKLFRPDCMISGHGSCALDWEEAHFFSGKAVSEAATEAIQREMERCDRVQAFVFLHSLGGGCGSGLTTSVVTELAQERLFQPPVINFAFVPSSCTVDPITNRKLTTREAFNTMLGFNTLIEYSGATFLIDNGALKRSVSYLPILSTTAAHSAMNLTAAAAISGVTCPQRFPVLGAECLGSWRKLIHVGVPFPRAHFFSLSHVPFSSDGRTHCSTAELMREVFTEGACLTGLPRDATPLARSHWGKTTSFFNFVCVRGRRASWRDAARELEAIKQHRRSLPPEADGCDFSDEEDEDEENENEDEDDDEGDARTSPTTVNVNGGAQTKTEEEPVEVDEEDDDDDTLTTFIPRETEWLPDSHVRYAYCPVAYAPPSSSSSSSSSLSSALGDGASATLVSGNTRTFSRYLARFFDRFGQLPDASALCTEDRLLLYEAQSNLSDLQSEFRHT